MFKKDSAFLAVLLAVVFIFGATARAQETEAAASSNLTGVTLPAGAERILPGSLPASLTEGFDKVVPADGSVARGDIEALVWMGADYKMANAPATISRLTTALKAAGWQYAVERDENGICVFSAIKEGAKRRAVIGYYGATKEALVLAWMELLPANGSQTQNRTEDDSRQTVENNSAGNTGGGSIVGTWSNGYVSLIGFTPSVGPQSYTPGRSNAFKYVFHPNGTFEFTGIMQFTQYGCTTSYFQDKRGRFTVQGNQIKLALTKNFWRQQNSCAASGNKEINHKLDPETYTFSVRRNKYGKDEFCLNSGEGDSCYERGEK
jgi:hypothetical protein